jgi:hypothetical protein
MDWKKPPAPKPQPFIPTNMFNLEQSIAEWRRRMLAAGVRNPNVLDELESHLREDVERQAQSGTSAPQAFKITMQRIGQPAALQNEFTKTRATIQGRMKHFISSLTGVFNLQLAGNMNISNLNPNDESPWTTYFKAAIFLMPAAFIWLFSVVFLLPKLDEFCHAAGLAVFSIDQGPAIFRAVAGIGQVMVFLTAHGFIICSGVVFVFMLLEWRSRAWPRYRRTTVGTGIYLFNLAVLLSIMLMVVSAIVAITALMQHVK